MFTTYGNGFINLDLYVQIFLSISISFPISTIYALRLPRIYHYAEDYSGGFLTDENLNSL